MELNLKLEQVHDRDSFFEFVRQLVSDRRMEIEREAMDTSSPSPHDAAEWENSTIDSYLDAALSWAEDTGMGTTQGLSPDPSWKEFATFLYLGKIYE